MKDFYIVWLASALTFILALSMSYNGDIYYATEFKWIAILLFFFGLYLGDK
jgi:hypothetical protein